MKIGFIGCGNMGSAMIGGILKNGVFEKMRLLFQILQKKEAEEVGKTWSCGQLWITVKL